MYIDIKTNKVLSESDIKNQNPNQSFTNPFVPPDRYKYIFPSPVPPYDVDREIVKEVQPVFTIKGHWEQRFEVVKLSQEAGDQNVIRKVNMMREGLTHGIQEKLDNFAKTRGYDSILSACTYATSKVNKFRIEGQYCVDARDLTWATCYEIMEKVKVGIVPVPKSLADIEHLLPKLEWPINT